MKLEPLAISDVILLQARSFKDDRGAFSETWNNRVFKELGIDADFVQDNHVKSTKAGTLRGLHYQAQPHAQGKLIRVIRGAIFDVAVDMRSQSPSYGGHVSATLTAESEMQIWVPAGFAHGYVTLESDTEVLYKVTDFYAPETEGGIVWSDPDLAIAWPFAPEAMLLSEKDLRLPLMRDGKSPF